MSERKSCAVIGHRDCVATKALCENLKETMLYLIKECGVTRFLFGSKSKFNDLCHEVVTGLKGEYSFLERVKYTCASEGCVLEKNRVRLEEAYALASGKQIKFLGFECEVEHKNKYVAGVASYIERNYAMIDDADYLLIYCDEICTEKDKYTFSKSGTIIALDYAKRKKKNVINVYP